MGREVIVRRCFSRSDSISSIRWLSCSLQMMLLPWIGSSTDRSALASDIFPSLSADACSVSQDIHCDASCYTIIHFSNYPADKKMPQHNERVTYAVSDIDYSEARTVLDLTTGKQKQLRRQRAQALYTQLLLKRTYAHVCNLLDSESSPRKALPLSTVDTNKRKVSASISDDEDHPVQKTGSKRSKSSLDHSVLQFLLELNAVKVTPRY